MKQCTAGTVAALVMVAALAAPDAHAQRSLSATIEVYVFPREGQSSEEQSKAEAECYDFAVERVGSDPWDLSRQLEQEKQAARENQQRAAASTRGAGVSGAARGAAAGALIGAIADDRPGQGSAWGAAAGMMGGRRSARRATRSASQQANQQVAQAERRNEEAMRNFRNAFAVCLEAKDYMVRF